MFQRDVHPTCSAKREITEYSTARRIYDQLYNRLYRVFFFIYFENRAIEAYSRTIGIVLQRVELSITQ
jgi:hypothetical protein